MNGREMNSQTREIKQKELLNTTQPNRWSKVLAEASKQQKRNLAKTTKTPRTRSNKKKKHFISSYESCENLHSVCLSIAIKLRAITVADQGEGCGGSGTLPPPPPQIIEGRKAGTASKTTLRHCIPNRT